MGELIDFNEILAQKQGASKKKTTPKKKSKSNSLFIFKVILSEGLMAKYEEETYRILSIPNSYTLSKFAEAILDSFDFELDHMYGFYDNLKNWARSNESYIMEEDEDSMNSTGFVTQVTVEEAFDVLEKKLLFVFDFGDEWKFIVELIKQETPSGKVKLSATVIETVGEAPPQYPDFEA
ncbi:MAG: hypothetical protein KA146_04140 [Leptospiraceae bacterium]|jgi:hypothetical protein|nr:hypothetical protein [Leptospiraceae bacterium]